MINMAQQFECPACGGMIDYPDIDKIIEEYDLSDTDKYYYEDVFDEELKIECGWCKKRVEIPLDTPETALSNNLLNSLVDQGEAKTDTRSFCPWPYTLPGKIVLGVMLLIFILAYSVKLL